MKVVPSIFSQQELDTIRALPEVSTAYKRLEVQSSAYFTIPASQVLKQRLAEHFQLDLSSLSNIPCRWIKGDTPPHVDRGQRSFNNTYLVYLTDGEGKFCIEDEEYSITAGTGFAFSEGLQHKAIETNGTSRLLLGPMSEAGFAVGSGINPPGGTIIYIRQQSGVIEYSADQVNWIPAFFSFNISNSNPSLGFVKVYFITDITLSGNSDYFGVLSDYIQFGNESLNPDGTRPIITITAPNYNGFINNGSMGFNGYNNIRVCNLIINGTDGSLQAGAGWFGQQYFGLNATDNYITNCSSSGDIGPVGALGGGGILGDYAENVTLTGCSSSGTIKAAQAGGICGQLAIAVVVNSCWSTGTINGDGAGGILGGNTRSATITNCYSEGELLAINTGGILGSNSGILSVQISQCYSKGNITGANSGGICGSLAPASGIFTVSITNCYSIGNIFNSGTNTNGGICGILYPYGTGVVIVSISHCYASGSAASKGYIIGNTTTVNGTSPSPSLCTLINNFSEAAPSGGPGGWSNSNANTVLQGAPIGDSAVGNTWANPGGVGQPYEFANVGYSPYVLEIIVNNAPVRTYSQTITAGGSTNAAIKYDAGGNYLILEITGGDQASRDLITMNAYTGVITVPASVVAGVYTIYLRSVGSYNITTFTLTASPGGGGGGGGGSITTGPCCAIILGNSEITYTEINNFKTGNTYAVEKAETPTMKFSDYGMYLKLKMAQAGRRG